MNDKTLQQFINRVGYREAAKILGVADSTAHMYGSGRRFPSRPRAQKIAKQFGWTLEQVMSNNHLDASGAVPDKEA
jgi:DNA-binding XRE family transcriptional regulator